MHLLIPHACSTAADCRAALRTLRLPNLERALARMALTDADAGAEDSLSPPHERALAGAHGMSTADGLIAWAARDARGRGLASDPQQAWAWVTPAHWDVGSNGIVMRDPALLALDEEAARALLATMQAYFAEDGIQLHFHTAGRWLASAPFFADLPTASLDRVAGTDIGSWMPASALVRRLQNEMQMLLYTHPVNDRRSAARLAPVNSFWLSATGRLPAGAAAAAPADLLVDDRLAEPARAQDWPRWAAQWQALDAAHGPALLQALAETPSSARLTLCGSRSALRFETAPDGWMQRLQKRWRSRPLHDFAEQL